MMYSAIENHSSDRNSPIRFAAPTMNVIPAVAASSSAKNSATWSSRRDGSAPRRRPGMCSTEIIAVTKPMAQSTTCASAVQRSR